MRRVCLGNGLLIVCSLFYLAWWIVAFRPNTKTGTLITGSLLVAASATGIAAIVYFLRGIHSLPVERIFISTRVILWGGGILYLVLLLITSFLLKRQLTSELLLIVGWAVLEFYAVNTIYGAGRIELPSVIFIGIGILVAVVISLVCYVLYYRLEGRPSYIDGMVPLITEAITMVILEVIYLDI